MLRALSLVLLLAACGPSAPAQPTTPPPPPPPVDAAPVESTTELDRDLPRLAERATRLYQDVAQAFATAKEDCPAATAKLVELQRTYADVVTANAKVLHEGRARELRAALEPHAEALDAAAKAIVESPTMSKCSQDRQFTDVFDQLVGAPP